MPRMGFERRRPLAGYGHRSTIMVAGRECKCASDAEVIWLRHIEPAIVSGDIREWDWQPKEFSLSYNYRGKACCDTYRPDCIIKWRNGPEEVIEIKRGYLGQKATSRMKRFAIQYPDKKLVLVWIGYLPKKGKAKRHLDTLMPHLDHIWEIKP